MTPKAPTCSHCEQVMERDYMDEHSRHTPASGFPYVTSNITGSPITVTDLGHERELCRIHGVTKRDDAAWLTKEHAGLDWRTGKPIYRESSGVGDPGCWV
jgi:hypothetical protein